jgi:hypothetical protein
MGRSAYAVEAKLTKADGLVFANEWWLVGTREISGIAEEIARWILAQSPIRGDCEAMITIRGGIPTSGRPLTQRVQRPRQQTA